MWGSWRFDVSSERLSPKECSGTPLFSLEMMLEVWHWSCLWSREPKSEKGKWEPGHWGRSSFLGFGKMEESWESGTHFRILSFSFFQEGPNSCHLWSLMRERSRVLRLLSLAGDPQGSALPWSWSKFRTGTTLRQVRHSPGAQKFRGCPQILVIKINMILMQYFKNQNECKNLQ